MAKILLINPVIRENDVARHVPYGLALNAAVLIKDKHQVQLYDANAWRGSDEDIVEVVKADEWDIIATGGITTSYRSVKKIVDSAKKYSPKSLTVVGGGLVTSIPRDIMKLVPNIDIGVVGEAVKTLPEIAKMSDSNNLSPENIKGIAWRDDAGNIILNEARELLMDLDTLPFPAWELFPLEEIYFPNSQILLSEESMSCKRRLNINTSYGCSLICKFCFHLGLVGDLEISKDADCKCRDAEFTNKRVVRYHSPKYIIELVKYARDKFNVDFITFLDENLMSVNTFTKGKWLPEICDRWVKAGLQPECIKKGKAHNPKDCKGIHWGGEGHAAFYTKELLETMKHSGCSYIDYGFESFSSRILKTLGKGSTPELNEKALIDTLNAGIRPVPNQIIGFPDDFFDSILDNMKAWDKLGIRTVPFFATPYPGSRWYYEFKEQILKQYDNDLNKFLIDLDEATDISAVISQNFNAVELLGIRDLMIKKDYKRIIQYAKEWKKMHGEPKFIDPVNRQLYEKIKHNYEYEKK